jgi:YbgC/YbaW family acyl-CoA thioester hydrolase
MRQEGTMMREPFVVHEYVRWSDVDPMGIIRYDAYTRFYELAESELFRSVGVPHRALGERFGISVPRRVVHMDFVSPPVLDERLAVLAYISKIGTTSLRLEFDIYGEGGALRSTGYLVVVCVDASTPEIAKRPWPAELLRLLERYRMDPGEARARP